MKTTEDREKMGKQRKYWCVVTRIPGVVDGAVLCYYFDHKETYPRWPVAMAASAVKIQDSWNIPGYTMIGVDHLTKHFKSKKAATDYLVTMSL